MDDRSVVTIIGNIGSGKSTALPIVTKALAGVAVEADSLFQTFEDPFARDYLNDMPRWALANELWLTNRRADIIKQTMSRTRQKWLIIDSGFMMSWVYAHGHILAGSMTKDEGKLYDQLFDKLNHLKAKQKVIYLECTIGTVLSRIKKRGRKFELEYYTPQYLGQLEKGLQALVRKLKREQIEVLVIKERDFLRFDSDQLVKKELINFIQAALS